MSPTDPSEPCTPSHSFPSLPYQGIIADDGIVPYLVTLRVLHGGGPGLLSRRLISLHPGETTTLGRLSKNHKTEFIAKSTNGYFDNPIISRCHALLENRFGEVTLSQSSPSPIPCPCSWHRQHLSIRTSD